MIPKIYCEIEFWNAFVNSLDEAIQNSKINPNASNKLLQLWRAIYNLKSDIFFNCSKEQIVQKVQKIKQDPKSDECFLTLWKQSANGCRDIRCIDSAAMFEDKNFVNANYNIVYFSKDTMQTPSLQEYGILNVCFDDLEKYDYKEKYIERNSVNRTSWKNYKEYIAHPCNSIVLIDNYILANEQVINTDFMELIQILLPSKSLAIPVHIFIITQEKMPLSSMYQKVNDCIKQCRPQLNFSLTICPSSEFHDRCIITNNAYIWCGAGFGIFKKQGYVNKPTTISKSFFFYDYYYDQLASQQEDSSVKTAKKILNHVKKISTTTRSEGAKEHRLLK